MTLTTPTPLVAAAEQPIGAVEPLRELDAERRRKLLGRVVVAGVVFVTLMGSIFAILAGRITWGNGVTIGLDIALVAAWRLRRRYLQAATILTIVTVAIAVHITMLQTGGLRSPVLVVLPVLPVLVASFAGARGATWMGGLLVLGAVAVGCVTRLDLMPPSLLSEAAMGSMGVAYALSSVGLAVYVARMSESERRQLEASLHARSRALYETSVHDPLTHLYNRRYLSHRLDEELAFAARHGTGLGVVVLDVDFFKRVNDEHGHGGGDDVLVALGAVLHNAVRREDIVARYGGEEFAIVLRGLDLSSVAVAAERVRSAVESHAFVAAGHALPITVSAGCASLACCGPTKTVAHLLAVADARLYRAKQSGRNRVAFTE